MVNMSKAILRAQKQLLQVAVSEKGRVYLVGGTALAIRCGHRYSEDLDFFTQKWTKALHRELSNRITKRTGYPARLIDEKVKSGMAKVAAYDFQVSAGDILRVDVVEDFDGLLHPVGKDGIASLDDLYLRKIRAVIGWRGRRSSTGQPLSGGRQHAKDLFDLWYLSEHQIPLHEWFSAHFGREDYARLARWLRTMAGQKTTFELLEVAPGCDTKRVVRHLESQVYDRLNRIYVSR